MYVWIWRKLPGGGVTKLAGALLLAVAVVAVLFLVVFPWIGPRLPFNHVTVDTPTPAHTSAPATAPPATVRMS
jgi:hypothetical protein